MSCVYSHKNYLIFLHFVIKGIFDGNSLKNCLVMLEAMIKPSFCSINTSILILAETVKFWADRVFTACLWT